MSAMQEIVYKIEFQLGPQEYGKSGFKQIDLAKNKLLCVPAMYVLCRA